MRSAPGPVRDRWCAHLAQIAPRTSRFHRIPLHVTDTRLLGGLDLAATLKAGRPIAERGILAAADGGIVALAMAERITEATAAKITSVLDTREVILEREGFTERVPTRFAVIALDEGIEPDERPPASLLDRLSLHLDLNGLSVSATSGTGYAAQDTAAARRFVADVRASDEILVALCEAAAALGIDSARAPCLALRVARAAAALQLRSEVTEEDAALAARLVFAPRAMKAPADRESSVERRETSQQSEERPPQSPGGGANSPDPSAAAKSPEPPGSPEPAGSPELAGSSGLAGPPGRADSPAAGSSDTTGSPAAGQSLQERVLAAAKAVLPPELISRVQPLSTGSSRSRHAGRTGSEHISRLRGRPTGTCAGDPSAGARMNVIETLRAAAPWQTIRRRLQGKRLRGNKESNRIRVIKDDFRINRFKRRDQTTTIFLVDASGSAAFNRLAEVKGAVELMLADSYVRRDRVALITFRGTAAQLLLPPTNSLVRAKRELASLPGGGGTPMALGLDAARILADSLRRRGEAPIVVVLTDGRPNIARDGKGNRARAEADTVSAARMMRVSSITSLMVDTAAQPRTLTAQFAREMGAKYVPLPYADAGSLTSVLHQCGVNRSAPQGRPAHA